MRAPAPRRRRPGVAAARRWVAALLAVGFAGACGARAQQADPRIAVSSDPALAALAAELLPDLARRSGLELREPVTLKRRSRQELVRYLESKLDEDLPEAEARVTVEAYALLGLLPSDLDLRSVLMDLYTEQVAGFYEPDSTALFVLDDQAEEDLEALLIHELVHAVQDQSADIDGLTDPDRGNDRSTAAHAAIEGHATLVMLEYLAERAQGGPVDLGSIPDFGARVRPTLQAMASRYPALIGAPRIIRETLLFPYVEGAGFVQALWSRSERVAPFGPYLPTSTEQVLTTDRSDAPVELDLDVAGGRVAHTDVLGRLELGVLLDEHLGEGSAQLARGWGGDRYVLVHGEGGASGLVWWSVWDGEAERDRFVVRFSEALSHLGPEAALEPGVVDGRPAAVLRLGRLDGVTVRVSTAQRP